MSALELRIEPEIICQMNQRWGEMGVQKALATAGPGPFYPSLSPVDASAATSLANAEPAFVRADRQCSVGSYCEL